MAEFSDAKSGAYCMCTREKCSDECRTYRRFRPKPVTNADRIRSMSDEELAEWLDNIDTAYELETVVSQHGWLDWMRQEVTK